MQSPTKSIHPLLALALHHRDQRRVRTSQDTPLRVSTRLAEIKNDQGTLNQLAVRWQLN